MPGIVVPADLDEDLDEQGFLKTLPTGSPGSDALMAPIAPETADPLKATGAGNALSMFAPLLSSFGSAIKAFSSIQEGNAAAGAHRQSALAAMQAANDAVTRANFSAMQARMQGGLVIGQAQAGYAASRVSVGSESAVTNAQRTRALTDINAKIVQNNAAKEAYGYRSRSANEYQEAQYAQRSGQMGALSSIIGGVGNVAGIMGPSIIDNPGRN